jgi:hypothetical protein
MTLFNTDAESLLAQSDSDSRPVDNVRAEELTTVFTEISDQTVSRAGHFDAARSKYAYALHRWRESIGPSQIQTTEAWRELFSPEQERASKYYDLRAGSVFTNTGLSVTLKAHPTSLVFCRTKVGNFGG